MRKLRWSAAPFARMALVLSLLAALPPAATARDGGGASAPSTNPITLKVRTSRGQHDLLLYAPSPRTTGSAAGEKPLVLLLSGEGGWRTFDRLLADWLAEAGYFVGGVSALDYFWEPQDDRALLAADFRAYAAALAAAAGRPAGAPLVFAGFSFGADLAPWIAGAGGWDGRVRGLLMIGPDRTGSLSFRFSEILGFDPKDHVFSVAEALRSASGLPVAFIHGEEDTDSYAPELAKQQGASGRIITIPKAGHHFSGHERELRDALLQGLGWIEAGGAAPGR